MVIGRHLANQLILRFGWFNLAFRHFRVKIVRVACLLCLLLDWTDLTTSEDSKQQIKKGKRINTEEGIGGAQRYPNLLYTLELAHDLNSVQHSTSILE